LFREINAHSRYLILRNYEDIEEGRITLEGHDDIDILCDDTKMAVQYMHAFSRLKKDNGKSYLVCFNGQNIKLDIRHVGDGYYDRKWQETMLNKRKWNPFGFYVMDEENYYYSLAYHGLFQKRVFAQDYNTRLKKMAESLGFKISIPSEHIEHLNEFMKIYGYRYTDPTDPTVYINFSDLPRELVHKNYLWRIRRKYVHTKIKIKSLIKSIIKIK
jgi:hypothetical protein